MRLFVLIAAALEAVLWAIVTFEGDMLPRRVDPAGFHFFLLFGVLPAVGLCMVGHGSRFAVALVTLTGFVFISTVLAGFIAG
jgi:hypothetical protein